MTLRRRGGLAALAVLEEWNDPDRLDRLANFDRVMKAMEDWDPSDRRPMVMFGKTTKGYWPAAVGGKIPGAGDQIVGFASHPYGFKMNTEYIVALARTFELIRGSECGSESGARTP